MQAGVGGEQARHGVDGDGAGGEVAVDAALDDHVDWRFAFDHDAVVGVVLADGGLELQVHHAAFIEVAACDLADAGDFTFGDDAQAAHHVAVGADGADVFFPVFDGQVEVVRDEVQALAEADMAERAVGDFGVELVIVEADADLLLERDAAAGGVLDAVRADGGDLAAHGGGEGGEGIHEEAGVDAGAEQAAAVLEGEGVEFVGEGFVAEPGEGSFFAGGDDGLAAREDVAEGGCAGAEVAGGGDEDGVDVVPVFDLVE